jgi:taurine--2-oxoglutarate transaminase
MPTYADIERADAKHVFRTARVGHGALARLGIARSQGPRLWDFDGNSYLDFSSQWAYANLGHQHPRLIDAITDQAHALCTLSPTYVSEIRVEAASKLAEIAPEGLETVFFTGGGGEANEHAVRMARLFTGRHKVLTSYRSYHGSTSIALALTGDRRRWPLDMAIEGVVHFETPYPQRSVFKAETEAEEYESALSALERVLKFEGPQTVAAILIETIPSGARPTAAFGTYLRGVRELCDRWGITLIFDEVVVGFGRTGAWFARDHWGVTPDLMTIGKGVTSGYVPLGGVIICDRMMEYFEREPYPMPPTFSGHPLAAAACVANIEIMKSEGVIEHSLGLGEDILGPGLRAMARQHAGISEIRGIGTHWTVEVDEVADPRVLAPDFNSRLEEACRRRGLIMSQREGSIGLLPPCNTPAPDVQAGVDMFAAALEEVWSQT